MHCSVSTNTRAIQWHESSKFTFYLCAQPKKAIERELNLEENVLIVKGTFFSNFHSYFIARQLALIVHTFFRPSFATTYMQQRMSSRCWRLFAVLCINKAQKTSERSNDSVQKYTQMSHGCRPTASKPSSIVVISHKWGNKMPTNYE